MLRYITIISFGTEDIIDQISYFIGHYKKIDFTQSDVCTQSTGVTVDADAHGLNVSVQIRPIRVTLNYGLSDTTLLISFPVESLYIITTYFPFSV